jgi:hypothetical protein
VAFGLDLAERRASGAFNVVTPAYPFEQFVEECARVAGQPVEWVWVDEDWLLAQGVRAPWELPVWLPGEINRGRLATDPSRALESGMRLRPMGETLKDTLEWDAARPRPLYRGPLAGRYDVCPLEPEREAELLQRWRAEAASLTSSS